MNMYILHIYYISFINIYALYIYTYISFIKIYDTNIFYIYFIY